jgi:uncharacterized protein YciI
MKPTSRTPFKPLPALASVLVISAPLALAAQQTASAPHAVPAAPAGYDIPKNMTAYYVASYVRGPKYMENESPERQELSKRHLSFIRRMIEQKRYVLAGPFADDKGPQLGLAIIAAPDADEARRIAAGDPAIVAGHMAVELRAAILPSLASLVVTY